MPISGVLRQPWTFCTLRHARSELAKTGILSRLGGPITELKRQFHPTTTFNRSNALRSDQKIASKAVFDDRKIQRTMNKVMGVRGPINKVAYKPSLVKTTYGSSVKKHEFQLMKGASLTQENSNHESVTVGPTPGNVRRARQLSDVFFLRITEIAHIGGVHPIFQEHNVEIVKVNMLPDMRNLHVYWATTGNPQVDDKINRALTGEVAWLLRRQLAELQVIGRTPTVSFKPDDTRHRLNHVAHLIEISDKPPEDEEEKETANDGRKRVSKPPSASVEEEVIDLSKRISAFSFPPDAPTWAEMKGGVVQIRDARNFNHDYIMGQVLKAKVSANPALARQWDDSISRDVERQDQSNFAWRFNAQDKDDLTKYLRERKLRSKVGKMKRSEAQDSNYSDDDDDDFWDDDDDDDDRDDFESIP